MVPGTWLLYGLGFHSLKGPCFVHPAAKPASVGPPLPAASPSAGRSELAAETLGGSERGPAHRGAWHRQDCLCGDIFHGTKVGLRMSGTAGCLGGSALLL